VIWSAEDLDARPRVEMSKVALGQTPPGYPQRMQGMTMTKQFMHKVWSRREVQGMRASWPMSVKGLMTTFRVLPDDLYHKVMETDEPVEKGAIFAEIINRFGTPAEYQPAPPDAMQQMMHAD
jgi:manganese oxidase